MRSLTWPHGAYRQYPIREDSDRSTHVETISGVLHIKDTIFGHKWVYKLGETRRDVKNKVVRGCQKEIFIGVVVVILLVGLIVASVVFTIFGPKYLQKETNVTQNSWSYQISSVIQNKIKLIFNNNDTKSKLEQRKLQKLTLLPTNVQVQNSNCLKCLENEICLQNTTTAYPECISIKDADDPTGCGGLCKLEVQYCKKLDATLNIFSCIDIQKIICTNNHWKCNETLLCIPENQKCDGKIHCEDKSDEFNCDCDLKSNFRCGGNISCIPNTKKCDGSVDCWDNSDEIKCVQDCGPDFIPCFNGECVLKDKFCDGKVDCKDKSDEPKGCDANN